MILRNQGVPNGTHFASPRYLLATYKEILSALFVQNSKLTLVLFGFLQAIFLNPRELFLWVLNQREHPCTSLGVDNTLCMDTYFSLSLLYNSRSTHCISYGIFSSHHVCIMTQCALGMVHKSTQSLPTSTSSI